MIYLAPEPTRVINPCVPNPCGPNSECRAVGDRSSCSCVRDYIGSPPNCRPECVSSSECRSGKSINVKYCVYLKSCVL